MKFLILITVILTLSFPTFAKRPNKKNNEHLKAHREKMIDKRNKMKEHREKLKAKPIAIDDRNRETNSQTASDSSKSPND